VGIYIKEITPLGAEKSRENFVSTLLPGLLISEAIRKKIAVDFRKLYLHWPNNVCEVKW